MPSFERQTNRASPVTANIRDISRDMGQMSPGRVRDVSPYVTKRRARDSNPQPHKGAVDFESTSSPIRIPSS